MVLTPKTAYFVLGLGGLLVAAVLGLIGVVGLAVGGLAAVAPAAGICAGAAFFPGVVFLWMYAQANRRDRGLSEVGAMMEGYGEVSVATMAEKLGATEEEAERLMAMSIREGHARGRIDPKTRTFRKSEGG
ncbi:MAG: hypothetical protein A3K65_02945 [Euryarchaeota archaeon RBG_16_68_12]|nr:MAG: hypothetical protein A3K65_02945 [Euryarchaeota archaeon RBG_16_68_12]